jgi:hypothetical protein
MTVHPDSTGPARRADIPTAPQPAPQPLPEAHLLDLGDLVQVAQWIAMTALQGVISRAGYDLVQALVKRYGRDRVRQLQRDVMERATLAAKELDEAAAQRIRDLFQDLE